MVISLKGISSALVAQDSVVDGSAESALQWMSGLPGEWLIVFDNADNVPLELVSKFIPAGDRNWNCLTLHQNQ